MCKGTSKQFVEKIELNNNCVGVYFVVQHTKPLPVTLVSCMAQVQVPVAYHQLPANASGEAEESPSTWVPAITWETWKN